MADLSPQGQESEAIRQSLYSPMAESILQRVPYTQ